MNQSPDITKLAAALVAAQSQMKAIAKDSDNPHFKSRFLSLDGIIEAMRPILAANKLAVSQGATVPHTDAEGRLTGFTGETMLLHESGQWLTQSIIMPVGKSDPQGVGSALTYFRRYGLAAMLGISSDEDDDGNSAQPAARRAAPRQTMSDNSIGEPITRDTELTFGTMKGKKISEMKDAYLQWALEPDRKFGPRTTDWQAAFRTELASRDGAK